MSTCKEPSCYGWTGVDLCTLHRAEKAEARVAELEKAFMEVFCLLNEGTAETVDQAWRLAGKMNHGPVSDSVSVACTCGAPRGHDHGISCRAPRSDLPDECPSEASPGVGSGPDYSYTKEDRIRELEGLVDDLEVERDSLRERLEAPKRGIIHLVIDRMEMLERRIARGDVDERWLDCLRQSHADMGELFDAIVDLETGSDGT